MDNRDTIHEAELLKHTGKFDFNLLLLICRPAHGADAGSNDTARVDRYRKWAAEEACAVTVVYCTSREEISNSVLSADMEGYDCLLVDPGHFAGEKVWQDILSTVRLPVIQVRPGIRYYEELQHTVLTGICVNTIYGREEKTYRWAIRHAANRLAYPFQTIWYGDHYKQCGDLRIPGGEGKFPVCIIFHGGFWQPGYAKDMTDNLAVALTRKGFVTWNVDYRASGPEGGYPGTFEDTCAAVSFVSQLTQYTNIDPDNIFVAGHSAGGQLALWASAAADNGPDSATQRPVPPGVRIKACVSLAGILDMQKAVQENSGNGAVAALMGDQLQKLDLVSPVNMLFSGIKVLLVHGLKDETVHPDHSVLCHRELTQQHIDSELLLFEDADHMDIVKVYSTEWKSVEQWLINEVNK